VLLGNIYSVVVFEQQQYNASTDFFRHCFWPIIKRRLLAWMKIYSAHSRNSSHAPKSRLSNGNNRHRLNASAG
jgi:hypothetical protein